MGLSSSDAEPTLRGYSTGTRVFGRYTLIEILGRGGMGVVWRARDEILGEDVALKFLPDVVRWDPGAYDDLKGETRRARRLTHPNIVRIHDFVEDAGSAAISMEWVDGFTLTQLRLTRPNKVLEPADILPWLPQLAAALDYAHAEAQVVHRDLKPANLMLTREGRLKVTDFGVARGLADSITRVSMMAAGTLVYMSPEQAMGEAPSPADDIYALGATLYELLTGKPPFHTGDVRTQLFQRRPDPVSARRKTLGVPPGSVSSAWQQTIAACLAKEGAQRPTSAGEIAQRLGESATRPSRRTFRPARRQALLGGVAVALAVAAGVVLNRPVRSDANGEPAVHPSDATRALAAWNFDGGAQEGSGREMDGMAGDAIPTQDRFGRIDRALRFNGRSAVVVRDAPLLVWGGEQPFTAAVWVRHEDTPDVTGIFWSSMGNTIGSLYWGMVLTGGRAEVTMGAVQMEKPICRVTGPARLKPDTWYHVALVSDGTQLALYVDGQRAGVEPLGAVRNVASPRSAEFSIGRPPRSAWGLTGSMDEARVWRRALGATEIAQLASTAVPPRIAVTQGLYSDSDDLAAVVRDEFGEGAQVLDWDDLKRLRADDVAAWMAEMGLVRNAQNGWLQRAGQRFHAERRHYFLSRFDGTKPGYFLAHDEIGGTGAVLGSWFGARVPVFAVLPPSRITTESLQPAAPGEPIRRSGGLGTGRDAVALTWRAPWRAMTQNSLTVRLRLADGREVRAVCESKAEAAVAVVLGLEGSRGVSRNRSIGYGEVEFTLVARNGSIGFRAMSVVGVTPFFHEKIEIEGFRLAEVREIELESGPAPRIAAARLTLE